MSFSFGGIGLDGRALGLLSVDAAGFEWRGGDKGSGSGGNAGMLKQFPKDSLQSLHNSLFGGRHSLLLRLADNSFARLDGFSKNDMEKIPSLCKDLFNLEVKKEEISSSGANFGQISLAPRSILMTSSSSSSSLFELKLDAVAQCVVPANNRNELEIQFLENSETNGDRESDSLVQIT